MGSDIQGFTWYCFLDITSFSYDLDSIKLSLTDDNNKEISVEANEIISFSYINEQALYLNEFNFASGVDKKEFPHHFFYKVTNSTLIEQLVHLILYVEMIILKLEI